MFILVKTEKTNVQKGIIRCAHSQFHLGFSNATSGCLTRFRILTTVGKDKLCSTLTSWFLRLHCTYCVENDFFGQLRVHLSKYLPNVLKINFS